MKSGFLLAFLYVLIFTCSESLDGQDLLLFIPADELLERNDKGGPLCRAFADINGDYRDDIIRLDGNNIMTVDLSSDNGSFFHHYKLGAFDGDAWTIGVADLDNNGFNDIISAGSFNGLSRWNIHSQNLDFDYQKSTSFSLFAQGSNMVDINNDGWLDVFICNDVGLSKILINDGEGVLMDSSDLIDMRTQVPSDNSGNYASEWTDADGDGDLDLFIAKCRINVDAFDDPRRINVLYINEGDEFVERAESFGLALGAQSWTGNWGDIDNDGDMDLFVTNHDYRSILYENIDNDTFVEIQILESGQNIDNYAYQSAMADFNNDGYLDILVGGSNDYVLLNKGDNTFSINENPFGFDNAQSFAIGDANNDGFMDVLTSYNILAGNIQYDDHLFLNLPNENNFFGVNLKGTDSNINGIGARIELYGDWGVQTRILQSGTGYGVTHSLRVNFGIKDATTIDSLIIRWPSGKTDKYNNPNINEYYLAVENVCLKPLMSISSSNNLLDCLNNSSLITHNADSDPLWSLGFEAPDITVEMANIYSAVFDYSGSCPVPSQTIRIDSLPYPDKVNLSVVDDASLCQGDSIILNARDENIYNWSNGYTGSKNIIKESGYYYLINSNYCDTTYSDTLFFEFVDPSAVNRDTSITITEVSDRLILEVPTSFDIDWYRDPAASQLISVNNILYTDSITSDTSFYFKITNNNLGEVNYSGGPKIDQAIGENQLVVPLASVSTDFTINKSTRIHSMNVFALVEGERRLRILDFDTRDIIYAGIYNLSAGINTISIEFNFVPGDYIIETDRMFNVLQFGDESPELALTTGEVNYPYLIGDLLEITGSNLGDNVFGYFFDWNVSSLTEACPSEVFRFDVILDILDATAELDYSKINLFPNPARDILKISSEMSVDHIQILDYNGKITKELSETGRIFNIDISDWPAGKYLLKVYFGRKTENFTFIKS